MPDGRKLPEIRPLDLTAGEKQLHGALLYADTIVGRFCRTIRRALPFLAKYRAILVPDSPRRSRETHTGLVEGPSFAMTLESENSQSWATLVVDARCIGLLLDGVLGGESNEEDATVSGPLTVAQRVILRHTIGELASDLAAAVQREVGIELSRREVFALREGEDLEPRRDALTVDCQFEGMRFDAILRVQLGGEALEAIAEARSKAETPRGDLGWPKALAEVDVPLVVELGRMVIGVRQLMALEPGVTLRLPTSTEDSLPIRIGDAIKFTGVPAISRGQMSVKIDAYVEETQEKRAEAS